MCHKRWYNCNQGLLWSLLFQSKYSVFLCAVRTKLCDKPHIHTHKWLQRDNGRRGTPIVLCQATSRPIPVAIIPSNTHLHKPRRAQKAQWQSRTQIRDPKEQPSCLDSTQACPSRAIHPSAKTQKPSPQVAFALWGLLPMGGTFHRMQKKASSVSFLLCKI